MKRILLYVVLGLSTACTAKLKQGEVVAKHYEPARVYTILMPMRVGKVTIFVPYTVYDDEDYVLTVTDIVQSDTITQNIYVTKNCYISHNSGDHWSMDETCSYTDDNNTKTRE